MASLSHSGVLRSPLRTCHASRGQTWVNNVYIKAQPKLGLSYLKTHNAEGQFQEILSIRKHDVVVRLV